MPAVVVNLGNPRTPFHLPKIPGIPQFTNRGTKLLTAGAAIVISLSMVSFTAFSVLTNNKDYKKSHGIVSPTDNLQSSNTTEKSAAALPGGGTATGVGGTTGTNSPVVTLTAQPASVNIGSKTHLKWTVTNSPKSCVASDDWSGTKSATGEEDTAPLSKLQTYIYTLTCKTDTGTGFATVSVGATQSGGSGNVATRPTVHLAASSPSVYQGQTSGLTWDTTNNPTSCTASGDWTGVKATSGSEVTPSLGTIKSYTYTMTCSNTAGSGFATVTISAIAIPPDQPIVALDYTPAAAIHPGESVTLTWDTINSPTSCTASGDWTGSKNAAGGTQSSGALSAVRDYTYTITCSNETGSNFDSVIVSVIPNAPQISMTVSPSSILVGNSSTISWNATNTPTSCTASASPANANWTGTKTASGTRTTGTLNTAGNYYFSLDCTNAGGTGHATNISLTVTVPATPVVTVTLSPIAITTGSSATINWNATNSPTSCTGSSSPSNAGWNGARTVSGTLSTGVLNAAGSYSFTLSCTNAGGTGSGSSSVTVSSGTSSSPPVVSVNATPASIGTGSSSTISWSATNAPTSCTASGSAGTWVTSPGASGSVSSGVKNTAGTFTYTMTCSNSAGSGNATATLTVVAVPVVTISVNPASITTGSNTTVTWSATNSPTSCTASGNSYWAGSKGVPNGTQAVGPITAAGTYTFSMTCSNTGGASALASSSPLTVSNAVYCAGRTPCFGPNDMIAHNTIANCYGYNIDQVFNITTFNSGYHKNGKPGTNLFPVATSPLCGNANIASYLSGTSLPSVGSHNHLSSTKNNTNSTMTTYRVGYYDATKP